MREHVIVGIVTVIALGIGAQWLAWRIKFPSILLLLLVGFLAGPVFGILEPSALQGDWVFAFVSLSIGIILFEGGLTLRVSDLREVGVPVLNLITIGVLVTWALAALGAYYIAGFDVALALLVGSVLTVTGPTVVVPLLRHVRPSGRVGTVAKWEGITIDPVGAILAVLVLEVIVLLSGAQTESVSAAALHAVRGLLSVFFVSVGISVSAVALLVLMLHRRLIPDFMRNSVVLAILVVAFAVSNVLQEESGLLTATLMGFFLANQPFAPVRRILAFKEDLQVLLIASLFILLSARLEFSVLAYIDVRAALFLASLIFVVRPVAVAMSSVGTKLNWRELAFLAWLAPRGVVAAAVASLFALRLEELYPTDAPRIVPVVFLVIVGTVAVYGLTSAPWARYLGLAVPNPQGVLFLGAHGWARKIAKAITDLGFKVTLIDANDESILLAKREGLTGERANALSESVVDDLDLSGIGKFVALTPNAEVNALAVLNLLAVFESSHVYQLASHEEGTGSRESRLPKHLRGVAAFGTSVSYRGLSRRFNDGGDVRTFELTDDVTFEGLQERYAKDLIPLFLRRGSELMVFSEGSRIVPKAGDAIVVFMPPPRQELKPQEQTVFENAVERSAVLDLRETCAFSDVVRMASARLAERLPVADRRLERGFLEGSRLGATPVAHGTAIPHYRVADIEESEIVLVRCTAGIEVTFSDVHVVDEPEAEPSRSERVYALIFLASPEENPSQHLRILAHLANRIDDPDFMPSWQSATGESALKRVLLAGVGRREDEVPT